MRMSPYEQQPHLQQENLRQQTSAPAQASNSPPSQQQQIQNSSSSTPIESSDQKTSSPQDEESANTDGCGSGDAKGDGGDGGDGDGGDGDGDGGDEGDAKGSDSKSGGSEMDTEAAPVSAPHVDSNTVTVQHQTVRLPPPRAPPHLRQNLQPPPYHPQQFNHGPNNRGFPVQHNNNMDASNYQPHEHAGQHNQITRLLHKVVWALKTSNQPLHVLAIRYKLPGKKKTKVKELNFLLYREERNGNFLREQFGTEKPVWSLIRDPFMNM